MLGLPFSGLSLRGVSCIAEIILVMRYVEQRSQLHRMISVVKVRDAEIDCALHRFSISGEWHGHRAGFDGGGGDSGAGGTARRSSGPDQGINHRA